MLNPRSDEMRGKGRDHYKGVPECDLPDALIETHPAAEAAMLLTRSGRNDCFIQFCPRCGRRIGNEAQELIHSGFNPFD